jgi:hypothetical protein
MWGALSDDSTGLSFTIAADPRQRSYFRVRVPWDSRPYFTDSDSRLPFSLPPTTRMATVEVFDPASTRGLLSCKRTRVIQPRQGQHSKHFYCCVAQTTQETSDLITISPVHWRTDCCLATSYDGTNNKLFTHNTTLKYNILTLHYFGVIASTTPTMTRFLQPHLYERGKW